MIEALEALLDAGATSRGGCLVTPVATHGSLPTGRLARMAVFADGSTVGTVGGGRLEADATTAATGARSPQLLEFSLTARDAMEDGLLCGGRATLLVEPVTGDGQEALRGMLELAGTRVAAMEAVALDGPHLGCRLVVSADGTCTGTLGEAQLDEVVSGLVAEVLEDDACDSRSLEWSGGTATVFLNALRPRPSLVLFGGGHVGLALARIAPTAGFRTVVVDDREEFANRERFPMADEVLVRDFDRALDGLTVDALSHVVIMTRGHRWDRQVLAQVLRTPAGYIGMIGSRRKIALLWEALRQEGFSDADLARVHAPIGLDIGGDSPGEIAISIMAQLIRCHRRGGDPPPVAVSPPKNPA